MMGMFKRKETIPRIEKELSKLTKERINVADALGRQCDKGLEVVNQLAILEDKLEILNSSRKEIELRIENILKSGIGKEEKARLSSLYNEKEQIKKDYDILFQKVSFLSKKRDDLLEIVDIVSKRLNTMVEKEKELGDKRSSLLRKVEDEIDEPKIKEMEDSFERNLSKSKERLLKEQYIVERNESLIVTLKEDSIEKEISNVIKSTTISLLENQGKIKGTIIDDIESTISSKKEGIEFSKKIADVFYEIGFVEVDEYIELDTSSRAFGLKNMNSVSRLSEVDMKKLKALYENKFFKEIELLDGLDGPCSVVRKPLINENGQSTRTSYIFNDSRSYCRKCIEYLEEDDVVSCYWQAVFFTKNIFLDSSLRSIKEIYSKLSFLEFIPKEELDNFLYKCEESN